MRRIRLIALAAALLSLAAGALMPSLFAASQYAQALPILAYPLTAPDTATVLECSCGFATATLAPDGTILVMVQDYARGGRLFVYADLGAPQLTPVAETGPAGAPTNTPAFEFPAQKNGPGGLVVKDGMLIVYAPGRPVGVVEGPYNLMRYRQPWP